MNDALPMWVWYVITSVSIKASFLIVIPAALIIGAKVFARADARVEAWLARRAQRQNEPRSEELVEHND